MSYMDENEEIKSRIRIPAFTGDASTFKTISKKGPRKKVLFGAKSSNKKISSIERKQNEDLLNHISKKGYLSKDKFSLKEKLLATYFQCAKKETARHGSFVKCSYLEELIVQEDLSYFILKIYPSKIFLYYKNPFLVKYFYHSKIEEEQKLLDSIDNEEIPAFILAQIMSCENWNLMYDHHCFLHIQKYAFEDECAQPVFSDFVLLRPTNNLLKDLVDVSDYDSNNNDGSSLQELKEKRESKIFFEISGPLYLDVDRDRMGVMNLLKIYEKPFGHNSFKAALGKRPVSEDKQSFNIDPFKEELLKDLEEKIPQPSSSTDKTDFRLNGSPFSYVDLKEDLNSFLVERCVGITEDLYPSETTTLVEIFELMTSQKPFENIKQYLSVVWRCGQFYACLTLEKYTYDPDNPDNFISLIGNREELDRYILEVAGILSCRFTKFLSIQYKNYLINTTKFIPLYEPQMLFEHDEKSFETYRDTGTKKKGTTVKDPYFFDEDESTDDDELDFLAKHDLIAETDDVEKCKCSYEAGSLQKSPSNLKANLKDSRFKKKDCSEAGVLNRRLFENIFGRIGTVSEEASDIQSDTVTSLFGIHTCEEGENTDRDSPKVSLEEILESYPRITKFEFSEEDFMRDLVHDHNEDTKKLLDLISRV